MQESVIIKPDAPNDYENEMEDLERRMAALLEDDVAESNDENKNH